MDQTLENGLMMWGKIMKKTNILKSAIVTTLLAVGYAGVPVQADHHAHAIMAARDNADRPAEDKALDAARKAAEVLIFAGIAPGMTVLDTNSAGGYYTEMLSRTVGETGRVYAHNGAIYWAFMKEKEPKRFADGRLANVVQIHEGKETVDLPEGSLDSAIAVLAYHDYYYTQDSRPGGGHEDVPAVLSSIYNALKPGGSFIIVDHIAPKGTGPDDFDKLHRIDPDYVQKQMENAGFTLAATSDILMNETDDPKRSPFAEDLRRKTSRFVYKFVK